MASTRFRAAAKVRGVCCQFPACASVSAPCSIRSEIRPASPDLAARCKGVAPLLDVVAPGSAPASTSTCATSRLPSRAAMWRAVYRPMRVPALSLAPAYTSTSASSLSPVCAAQCKAVMPSPCAAFTSAPDLRRDRTASISPRIAASATGVSAVVIPIIRLRLPIRSSAFARRGRVATCVIGWPPLPITGGIRPCCLRSCACYHALNGGEASGRRST